MASELDQSVIEVIEAGRVRDFLMALDEPGELKPGEPVPALFLLTLGRTRRPKPGKQTSVKVADEHVFHAPVFVGDHITVTRRELSAEPKRSKAGPATLVTTEWTYLNQDSTLVGVGITRLMRWDS
jgi:hypothetical protein